MCSVCASAVLLLSHLCIICMCVGTIAEGAPIIPISAQLKYNVDAVCEYVVKKIPVPIRDFTSEPRLIGENSVIRNSLPDVLFQRRNGR